jgi:hypothetical protein
MAGRALACVIAFLSAPPLAAAERPPPQPPRLLAPPDDPENCIALEANGIQLSWQNVENPYPVVSYLEIRRYDVRTNEWRPWVKTYARPPFTLLAKNRTAYNAAFAWRVWAVDKTGQAEPYATPSVWQEFCTDDPERGDR